MSLSRYLLRWQRGLLATSSRNSLGHEEDKRSASWRTSSSLLSATMSCVRALRHSRSDNDVTPLPAMFKTDKDLCRNKQQIQHTWAPCNTCILCIHCRQATVYIYISFWNRLQYYNGKMFNILVYADDLVLLASTCHMAGIQSLLHIFVKQIPVSRYDRQFGIKFSHSVFCNKIINLIRYWYNSWHYLGDIIYNYWYSLH